VLPIEGCIFLPFLKEHVWRPGCFFSKRFSSFHDRKTMFKRVQAVLSMNEGKPNVTLDYSQFDATVPKAGIVFMLRRLLQPLFEQSRLVDSIFDIMEFYLTKSPLINPCTLELTSRDGGVPSGSGGTNLIDCIWNYLTAVYIICYKMNGISADNLGLIQTNLDLLVMGDDNFIQTHPSMVMDLTVFETHASTIFSLKLNVEKCTPGEYLGFQVVDTASEFGYTPLSKLVGMMICPEKQRSYPGRALRSR